VRYTCAECKRTPVRNSGWWRLMKAGMDVDQEGLIDYGVKAGGHWACGICCEHYLQGKQNRWHTIIFHEKHVVSPTDRYVFVGNLTKEQEATLLFLKGCHMFEMLNGQPPTKDLILRIIDELTSEVENKLLDLLPEIRTFHAADPSKHWWAKNFQPHCEDSRLSIQKVGQAFHAADLSSLPSLPSELTFSQVEALIEVLCASVNFEVCAGKGPAEKALVERLRANQGVQRARRRMLAICDQVLPRQVGQADMEVD